MVGPWGEVASLSDASVWSYENRRRIFFGSRPARGGGGVMAETHFFRVFLFPKILAEKTNILRDLTVGTIPRGCVFRADGMRTAKSCLRNRRKNPLTFHRRTNYGVFSN